MHNVYHLLFEFKVTKYIGTLCVCILGICEELNLTSLNSEFLKMLTNFMIFFTYSLHIPSTSHHYGLPTNISKQWTRNS
jgi:hypothetical protein